MNEFSYPDKVFPARQVIFGAEESAEVRVTFDPEDLEGCPIHVQTFGTENGEWLGPEDSIAVASAILSALGAEATKTSSNPLVIQTAISAEREIEFRYAKADGMYIETRRLKPGKMEEVSGHVLVIGFDPDREMPRAYRLDRIKGDVSLV